MDPVRDWLDYAAAISGVVGVLLAAFAVWYASRQSADAKRDLIRERRLEFELGLLAEIRRQMSVTQLAHLSGYVGALIRNADDEQDLPVLRALIGTKSGPKGIELKRSIVGNEPAGSSDVQRRLLDRSIGEVDEAIDRRLNQ